MQKDVKRFATKVDDSSQIDRQFHRAVTESKDVGLGLGDVELEDVGLGDVGLEDVGLGDVGLEDVGLGDVGLGDLPFRQTVYHLSNETRHCLYTPTKMRIPFENRV